MSILKIKAGITIASHSDMFIRQKPIENKLFFLSSPLSKSMEGIYKISGTDSYYVREIISGLCLKQFYKLSENPKGNDFVFKLVLRKATGFDLTYTPNYIIPNVYYYVKTNNDIVTGPHVTKEHDPAQHFLSGIDRGVLYVIHNEQTFEPYEETLYKSAI